MLLITIKITIFALLTQDLAKLTINYLTQPYSKIVNLLE